MAFPGLSFIVFSKHFVRISTFSDSTTANWSNILKWNVGPMSFLSWNHCLPKNSNIVYLRRIAKKSYKVNLKNML